MGCTGRGGANGDHCCWIAGEVCEYMIENYEGRRFACALRVELGDWATVYADPRYAPIAASLQITNTALCGDWFDNANTCCNEVR